jgi:hypothetical protein
MFGIRLKGRDVWAGNERITYFINEDGYFNRPIANQQDPAVFGVPFQRRKIWPDIDAVKRSLRVRSGLMTRRNRAHIHGTNWSILQPVRLLRCLSREE